ncbi:MAG: SpaA isopeptide-forming pilin-related protein, partial [Anaerovoracaceae bacterium]
AVEGHTHTDECYEDVLICDKAEHVHTEECYPQETSEEEVAEGETTGEEQAAEETGTEEITEEDTAEETAEETVGEVDETVSEEKTAEEDSVEDVPEEGTQEDVTEESATEEVPENEEEANETQTPSHICGLEEHTHTEECLDEAGNVICGLEEHVHTEECFAAEAETESDGETDLVVMEPEEYICGKEEHTHSDECYDDEGNLICELEEHVHDESCVQEAVDFEEMEAAGVLVAEGSDYVVQVSYTDEAQIPDDAVLSVREIEQGTEEYESYYQQAVEAVQGGDTSSLAFARFFDISFVVDGTEIEPAAAVAVKISYKDAVEVPEGSEVKSVHFGEETEVLDVQTNGADGTVEEVEFDANGFSVYGIVGTETLTGSILTVDGKTYSVTVTYGPDAKIPTGSELLVKEYESDSDEYVEYLHKTADELFGTHDDIYFRYARYFDITIMNGGEEIEPSAPVEVKISCDDASNNLNVIHFADEGTELIEDVTSENTNNGVEYTFEQSSFSVSGVYELPSLAGGGNLLKAAVRSSTDGPQINKSLDSNDDGTYTLSLSVTGKADSSTKNSNADVIVILDVSGSMTWDENGYNRVKSDGTRYYDAAARESDIPVADRRITIAENAVNSLAKTLLSNNTGNNIGNTNAKVRVSLVTFSNTASVARDWVSGAENSWSNLSNTKAAGGTNWEDALQTAHGISTRNDADVYVVFVSDGNPTYRMTRDRGSEGEDASHSSGTKTYYGSGNSDKNGKNYKWALDKAKAIVNAGKEFYTVGVFGNVDNMQSLTTEAGAPLSHYQTASDTASLNNAFENIIRSITDAFSYKDVDITDNITDLTATSLVQEDVKNFKYERSGGSYGTGQTWTDAPVASFDGSTVNWDLGSSTLENGVTYTVSFVVWPKQEAYDILSKLNNGDIKSYDDLTGDQKKQIKPLPGGGYGLQTNTDEGNTVEYTRYESYTSAPDGAVMAADGNSFTYNGKTYTKTTDDSGKTIYVNGTTGSDDFTNPDPVPLNSTKMKVKKVWTDTLTDAADRPQSITLQVTADGENFHEVTLSGDGDTWEAEIEIAPGIYVKPGDYDTAASGDQAGVLKDSEGHVYSVVETSYVDSKGNTITGQEHHYDLSVTPVKPMLDGTTTGDTNDMLDYLTMDKWSGGKAELTATNTVKGGLNIYKYVTTKDDASDSITCDKKFKITVTLTDNDNKPVSTIDYNQDGNNNAGELGYRVYKKDVDDDHDGFDDEAERGIIENGSKTLEISTEEYIRVVNVPVGTKYTVTEDTNAMHGGYSYLKTENGSGTVPGNHDTTTNVWNKRDALNIAILKVDNVDSGKKLANAEFSLLKEDGETSATDADGETIGTIISGTDGKAALGSLLAGTYLLRETKAPDGYNLMSEDIRIIVGGDGVTAMIGTSPCAVEKSQDGLTYTITVTNSAGVELPMTGGSGILPYTLGGIVLIMASALMYGFVSRRRRERRLR